MKKIFLIIALIVGVSGYSQMIDITPTPTAYTMDGDTSYVYRLNSQYYFSFQFVWEGLDATNGSVKTQISQDGINYVDYPSDSLLFDSASGTGIIQSQEQGALGFYIRVLVESGTCTSGTLTLYGKLGHK